MSKRNIKTTKYKPKHDSKPQNSMCMCIYVPILDCSSSEQVEIDIRLSDVTHILTHVVDY